MRVNFAYNKVEVHFLIVKNAPTTTSHSTTFPFIRQPVAQIKNKNIQFQVGSVLYKIAKFYKKLPLQPPLSTPTTLHLCPNSKIHSHIFLCLVKYFPKWNDITQYHQKPWSCQISGKRPGCRPGPTPQGLGRGTTHPKVTRHQPSNP